MKKFLFILALFAGFSASAQFIRFGIKAGPNFSNFNGGVSGIDYKARTAIHAGALVQLKLKESFALQPEVLYSSQGADVEGVGDFNLDYIAVPIMAKFYVLPEKLSIEAGPQFSFLVSDSKKVFNEVSGNESGQSFDFGLAAGLGLEITKNIWVQARYGIGLTEATKNAEVKNAVFQVSAAVVF